ncbi:hypothetical protein [Fusibacter sp. JL216-2]|uniref:hypothetical protein n=1 Tax=Fusibacter sp. JL216-2 TaxID=3071453 RepID=UPI003D339A22
MEKFCTSCGEALGQDSKYCGNCGQKVSGETDQANLVEKESLGKSMEEKQAKKKNGVTYKRKKPKKKKEVRKNAKKTIDLNLQNEEAGQNDQRKHKSKRPIGRIALLVLLLVMVVFKEDLLLFNVGLFLLVAGWTLFGMANPRLALPWLPPEKRTRPRLLLRGLISSVLIVCIIVWSLPGPVNTDTGSGNTDSGSVELISQEDVILVEDPSNIPLGITPKQVSFADGLQVVLPGMGIENTESLEIQPIEAGPDLDDNISKVHASYEITLGDHHTFDGHLEVSIPYEASDVISGRPEDVLEGMYYDEDLGQWIPVMTEVKESRAVLYMDHLTKVTLVESARQKARPTLNFNDSSSDILSQADEILKTGNMDKMELVGWSQAMNLYGFTGSGVTLADEVLKVQKMGKSGDIMKHLGVMTTLTQVYMEIRDGNYDSAKITSTKGFINFAIAHWGSSALNIAGVGIFFIDYSLNTLGSEAKALRQGLLDDIYGEYYKRNYRKPTEWYNKFWDIATSAQSQEDMKVQVEKEIKDYTAMIWSDDGAVAELQAELQGHGWTFEAGFTQEQKEKLEAQHRAFLIQTLQPVFKTVEKNLRMRFIKEKVEAEQRALNYLNGVFYIDVNLSGGMPGSTVKSELIKDGVILAIGEMYTLTDPYTNNLVAKFQMKRGDYIILGSPDEVQLTQIRPDGTTDVQIKALSFTDYGRGYVNFALEAPLFDDSIEDQTYADSYDDGDAVIDTSGVDDKVDHQTKEEKVETLRDALGAFFGVIEEYAHRTDDEAVGILQRSYDELIRVAKDMVDMSTTTGTFTRDFEYDGDYWTEGEYTVVSNALEYVYAYYDEHDEDTSSAGQNDYDSDEDYDDGTSVSSDSGFVDISDAEYNALSPSEKAYIDFRRAEALMMALPEGEKKEKARKEVEMYYKIYMNSLKQ